MNSVFLLEPTPLSTSGTHVGDQVTAREDQQLLLRSALLSLGCGLPALVNVPSVGTFEGPRNDPPLFHKNVGSDAGIRLRRVCLFAKVVSDADHAALARRQGSLKR